MIVLKKTHAVILAQRDAARAQAERLAARRMVEHAELVRLRDDTSHLREAGMRLKEEAETLKVENDRLRAELATTYVRNGKGQIVRHPSAAAQVRAA
ncbi:MAG: hypothetical protein P0Y64_16630 [Candidatus Sphingomonas colombiensis]|nr:hypothetical protein [Sphingomonas sp.]WEK42945.1 MAG: hypothetical protein P0Y64_16630 [Sphingomonas sp.]